MDHPNYYPPAGFVLGGLAALVGGRGADRSGAGREPRASCPLLALACYRVGRMRGRWPGRSAGGRVRARHAAAHRAVPRLHARRPAGRARRGRRSGSLLASERFARVGIAALAGVALGVGVETKELAAAVPDRTACACVLARGGGWRNWRGLARVRRQRRSRSARRGTSCHVERLAIRCCAAAGSAVGLRPAGGEPAAVLASTASPGTAGRRSTACCSRRCAPSRRSASSSAVARVVRSRAARRSDVRAARRASAAHGLALTLMPHHDLRYTMR